MRRDRLAAALGYVLHPIPVAIVSLTVLFHGQGYSWLRAAIWTGTILSALFIPVIGAVVHGRRAGRYATVLLDREERHGMYAIAGGVMAVTTAVLWWMDAPRIVLLLAAAVTVSVVLAGIVNRFTKVSVHAAAVTGGVMLMASKTPWLLAPGAAAVIGVCWSRVHEGKHTRDEVVIGALSRLSSLHHSCCSSRPRGRRRRTLHPSHPSVRTRAD